VIGQISWLSRRIINSAAKEIKITKIKVSSSTIAPRKLQYQKLTNKSGIKILSVTYPYMGKLKLAFLPFVVEGEPCKAFCHN
jgi:hypothetical protein